MNDLNDILSAATANVAALNASAEELALNPVEAPAPVEAATPAKKKQAKKDKAPAAAPAVPDLVTVEGDLGAKLDEVSDRRAATAIEKVTANFDARVAYEQAKSAASEKKTAKIRGYQAKLSTVPAAKLLIATAVDLNFMNQASNSKDTSRFNIYAIDKLADIVQGINTGHFRNAVNLAVMKSLFKFRTAEMPFTGELASAAVSDKIRVDKKFAAVLVRHTVDASTADTQSSSTLNALKVLGVVENIGTRQAQVWRLTDTPQTRRLEELVAA